MTAHVQLDLTALELTPSEAATLWADRMATATRIDDVVSAFPVGQRRAAAMATACVGSLWAWRQVQGRPREVDALTGRFREAFGRECGL